MRQRRIFFTFLAILALWLGNWWLDRPNESGAMQGAQAQPAQLKISFLDVGQGDAILIQAPDGRQALIDGGEDSERLLGELANQLGWFNHHLDLLILTHPHSDHVRGLNGLFDRFIIGQVVATLVNHNSSIYQFWLDNLRSRNITVTAAAWPQEFFLGSELKLSVLSPAASLAGQNIDNLNNSSLVILVSYGQSRVLLMGDAETEVEKSLLERGVEVRAQILKIGHHGSTTATSQEFLAAVSPQAAVISVGANNDFGHPHQRVLNRLERAGVPILRTDQLGAITFVSDGATISLVKEE